MNKIQEEISKNTVLLGDKHVVEWRVVEETPPPKNIFLLVCSQGYLPFAAIFNGEEWDDKTENSNGVSPTYWTEMPFIPCL